MQGRKSHRHGEKNEDVTIKVADQGGGITRSNLPKIWEYFYTTAPIDFENINFEIV